MGWLSKIFSSKRQRSSGKRRSLPQGSVSSTRRCMFETMEPRCLLAADPIWLGAVYIELDSGHDTTGDHFEITFSGGAPGTQLTRLIIDGDQGPPGWSVGDVFFDTQPGGLGADLSFPFTIVQLVSSNPAARVQTHVQDGSTRLVLDFHGFQAGDRLVFKIDVDEVEYWDPAETDLQRINDGIDPITSGVEFQGSQLIAYFTAPHYQDADSATIFWNAYDAMLQASRLDLPEDNHQGLRARTAGAFVNLQQEVNPASISGYVYADANNNGRRDAGEQPLAGVAIQIIPVDTIVPQATVTVLTNSQGFYEAVGLAPGSYRVVQPQQPAGYLDGLDSAGTVDGVPSGRAVNPGDRIEDVFLGGGSRGIEYNFGELLPASLRGTVRLTDADGNCYGSGGITTPLEGVVVQLWGQQGQLVAHTTTNALGQYEFTWLAPGLYSVIEITPEGLIDAGARAGRVGQVVRGQVVDPNTIVGIELRPGDQGTEYDFCEHLPAVLGGFVYHDRNDNAIRDAGEQPIAGVQIVIYDQQGNQVGTARTDANGAYRFEGLRAGTYRIVERQPDGWLDGRDSVGHVDGRPSGRVAANDTFGDVVLRWGSIGVDYNFGELLPGSIQGRVHADRNGDGLLDPGEPTLTGVLIELIDHRGSVVASTQTDSNGQYRFEHLVPGTYSVRETQPVGYFQGGQRAGSHGGDDSQDDLITRISIGSDQHLVRYDFWEVEPGSISGIVYVDPNQNQVFDAGEQLLAGVTVHLLDAAGRVVGTATTNAQGFYEFTQLRPGVYGVHEVQPDGFFHGGQQAGSHGGDASVPDYITAVVIGAGQELVNYNFSEIPPSGLSGMVYVTHSVACGAPVEYPLANVLLELLDAQNRVVATTRTDSEGRYRFEGLRPGTYSVRETQPEGYFQGGQCAGSGGGNSQTVDAITDIPVPAGVQLVDYHFYELPPGSISGYVFVDGPPIQTPDGLPPANVSDVRTGVRTSGSQPLAGVTLVLRHGLTGETLTADLALPGAYPPGPIQVVTDAHGYYVFHSLPRGNYAVYQIHPDGYVDGIDTPGTTSGIAFNGDTEALRELIERLAEDPRGDAIVQIALGAGVHSRENNFSEVLVQQIPFVPEPPRPEPPAWPAQPRVLPPGIPWLEAPIGLPPIIPAIPVYGASGDLAWSWHLSIVDGGMPRGNSPEASVNEGRWRTISFLQSTQWIAVALNRGYWTVPSSLVSMSSLDAEGFSFGVPGGIPVSGDWNGDGISQLGVFKDGHWFLDLNGNGRWDEGDMWAKLGGEGDLPVVGDWNGDGKDDIGIFGPQWKGDERAIEAEPGLPTAQNTLRRQQSPTHSTPKNLPPESDEATDGHRVLKRTAHGDPRVDVIDHVFRFGVEGDLPVVGDWNGDGIRSIGIFRGGAWYLDIDGDGRFTERDEHFTFGQTGDLPVVGDWNGDGIDKVGVFRQGTWHLDVNNNRAIDPDETVQLGQPGDKPVVGDWNGDGIDQPAVYRDAG